MVAGLAYTLLSYTKRFTSAPVIIFHFSLFSTVCAGAMMIPGFVVPSPKVVVMLLMVGLFAAGGQYLLTYAYQQAPASEVSIYSTAELFDLQGDIERYINLRCDRNFDSYFLGV